MVREILHHVSLLIIESPARDEILIGIYDSTYPLEIFRGRVNLIGGNQHPEDQSPQKILDREIREEFSIHASAEKKIEEAIGRTSGAGAGAPLPEKFAPAENIARIRDALLMFQPYADFLITAPYLKEKPPGTAAMYSVYTVALPRELFECASKNLKQGRAIKSEGFATIVTPDALKKGMPLAAGPTPFILSQYLRTTIPDPYGLQGIFLGKPRATLAEYEKEFRYTNVKRKQQSL